MDDEVIVPKSQQMNMVAHIERMEAEAAQRLRTSRNSADLRRAQDDLMGAQVMKQRVMREWKVNG
jgi:hypothetical protein